MWTLSCPLWSEHMSLILIIYYIQAIQFCSIHMHQNVLALWVQGHLSAPSQFSAVQFLGCEVDDQEPYPASDYSYRAVRTGKHEWQKFESRTKHKLMNDGAIRN